jgi:hypothetical protein
MRKSSIKSIADATRPSKAYLNVAIDNLVAMQVSQRPGNIKGSQESFRKERFQANLVPTKEAQLSPTVLYVAFPMRNFHVQIFRETIQD